MLSIFIIANCTFLWNFDNLHPIPNVNKMFGLLIIPTSSTNIAANYDAKSNINSLRLLLPLIKSTPNLNWLLVFRRVHWTYALRFLSVIALCLCNRYKQNIIYHIPSSSPASSIHSRTPYISIHSNFVTKQNKEKRSRALYTILFVHFPVRSAIQIAIHIRY